MVQSECACAASGAAQCLVLLLRLTIPTELALHMHMLCLVQFQWTRNLAFGARVVLICFTMVSPLVSWTGVR